MAVKSTSSAVRVVSINSRQHVFHAYFAKTGGASPWEFLAHLLRRHRPPRALAGAESAVDVGEARRARAASPDVAARKLTARPPAHRRSRGGALPNRPPRRVRRREPRACTRFRFGASPPRRFPAPRARFAAGDARQSVGARRSATESTTAPTAQLKVAAGKSQFGSAGPAAGASGAESAFGVGGCGARSRGGRRRRRDSAVSGLV